MESPSILLCRAILKHAVFDGNTLSRLVNVHATAALTAPIDKLEPIDNCREHKRVSAPQTA